MNQTDTDLNTISTELSKLAQMPAQFRKINTFMKRRTHMSQNAQLALTDPAFAQYIVNHAGVIGHLGDAALITDLRALFEHPDHPLTLEIGFGMGDSLIAMAKNAPETNFVGIEVHEAGIGRCAHLAFEQKLNNLKLINGDAVALLSVLPSEHIDTIQLFFPDPWQKKRHHKRRFVTTDRMHTIARVLKTGGIFHTATDWQHYAFWMLEVLDNIDTLQNISGAGQFAPRPDHRPKTKFEQRGIDSGHGVWDLLYQKINS